jgi:hypothetical protein
MLFGVATIKMNELTDGLYRAYDGDGKRAQKSNGKLYWYGMGSDPLTETNASGNPSTEHIFFNGRRTALNKLWIMPGIGRQRPIGGLR